MGWLDELAARPYLQFDFHREEGKDFALTGVLTGLHDIP